MSQNPQPSPSTGPDGARGSRYSFCIITNGKRPGKLEIEIQSIPALALPDVDILQEGEPSGGFSQPQVQVNLVADAADHGRLGEMGCFRRFWAKWSPWGAWPAGEPELCHILAD